MTQRLPLLLAAAGTGGGLGGLGFQVLSELLKFGRIEGSHPVPSFACPAPDLATLLPPWNYPIPWTAGRCALESAWGFALGLCWTFCS